jgi:hypothetical protein
MKTRLQSEKGMAMIEAVPLLVLFVVLLSFSLGFFGVIHTAILNSISARTYAFETFRDRTNLNFFREDGSGLKTPLYLGLKNFRFHAIQRENDDRRLFVPTLRTIAMGKEEKEMQTNKETHNRQIYEILDKQRNQKTNVNPVWVMVGYGICLNASCGE